MVLNYSSKHDISYASYNNKTIPWKVNTSIISQNNQNTNPSLNLGTINNNLVIESSQNDILFITSQNDNDNNNDNDNKKVIVKNNMNVNANLDVSNNLTTKLNVSYDISLNNIIYFPSLSVNIIGDLKVRGAISVLGKATPGLVKSISQFVNVTLSGSRFTDVSIVSSTISVSDFSNVNIINSYINDIPNGFGYDKSNNAMPNKAIFSDVSLQCLILDSSINSSYINFANNTSNAISIRNSADYSKLVISKPLNVGTETINNISNISNVSIFYGDISCNNLYYSRLVPDVKLNNYSDVSIGEVSISGNNVPTSNIGINIGSNAYKFNNTYSTNFNGDLSGQATLANNLIKNLDMSFNNLDICGTITLNKLNLNQFLSSDLTSIVDGNSSFITISNKVRDLSAIVYSKSDFDLCLNTHFTKISLVETSFVVLNGNITSVYSKSDFDLCLNRNILRINDVSAIASVVSTPPNIYPTLGYNDNLSIKQTNAKVSNELVFPYAITYIDDVTEDTNIKEAYSYNKTITRYTNSTTTKYIETNGPANVNLTRAVMGYVHNNNAGTSQYRSWFNTSTSSTLPAVYVNVKKTTSRVVSYEVNTTSMSWEQHRINAQQVRGRYLATILNITEQTAAANARIAANVTGAFLGGRRKTSIGGEITTSGSYMIHSFKNVGSDTFTPSFSGTVEVLIVGGGGAGGSGVGGGGGGGGVIYMSSVSVTARRDYPIVVGKGGMPAAFSTSDPGNTNGGASTAFNAIAAGGGTGGYGYGQYYPIAGGSGGGGGASGAQPGAASSGNSLGGNNGTIYGNSGGNMGSSTAGGGGGAGGSGVNGSSGGSGGLGIMNPILGTDYYWGGGGGGGANSNAGAGGIGGGGGGTFGTTWDNTPPGGGSAITNGSAGYGFISGSGGANSGGGGGGSPWAGGSTGGAGGSGIVVIRYLNQVILSANGKSSDSWEWHNGDPWSYEKFDNNQPDSFGQQYVQMWLYNNNSWDDIHNISLPAIYMTLKLQPIVSTDYQGNTSLLNWDNHKTQAETVTDRYLATIENISQNTWVADCINAMSISDIYKNGTGTYIGAMRTSGSTAYGTSSSDWQWTNGTAWSYTNFYYVYSPFIPQQPTNVSSSAPEGQQPITIGVSNTKLPSLISSVNGSITVTSSAISILNLPASTTSNIITGTPSTPEITIPTGTTREYTTTITNYTTTDTYTYNGTALVTSVTATGGNSITLSTNNLYRIHTFRTSGTFTPSFNGTVEVLLVGGGGGGGSSLGGGGGGGGVIYMPVVTVNAGQNYTIEVGSGGPSNTNGQPSKAFTAIAAGGGTSAPYAENDGTSGGSGGGAPANNSRLNLGGAGRVDCSLGINSGIIYGNNGGNMTTARISGGTPTRAAGGGGAGGQGLNTDPNIRGEDIYLNVTGDTGQTGAGSGGVGIINNILGTSYYWGGGGGGGAYEGQCGGYGGFGGGGGGAGNGGVGMGGINAFTNGSNGSSGSNANGGAGGANSGGGGGGGSWSNGQGGRGGDGIVIIRYLIEQPIGSFKISDNSNNTSYYITRPSNTNTTISTNYSCIALTNDGMFVALGKASDVTIYMKNSNGWTTIGSTINVDFSAYTETSVGIIPTQYTENWRKNLQNIAINFNYFSGSTTSQLLLAFGDSRTSIKVYSYSGGSWSFSNASYSVAGGSWGSTFLRAHNATTAEINNNNFGYFGYFVTLSQSPSILGFTVANKFYTYNCTTSDGSQRGTVQTLGSSHNSYTNIIAFKLSSDAEKIIVSNSYYVFIYKWNITDWTLLTSISYVSAAITFTYPNTSTTPIPAGPRSLDISNISSDECVFAIGFPDKLIDTSANRKARGYVEYWKYSNAIATRLATLVPRKRNIDNSNVDTDEYFFSAGGIKITNANTILVAPNFKFHLSSTNKIYTLAQNSLNWATHNNSSNAKAIVGREIASIENEADNELVKVSARNNNVWIGATRTSDINPNGITALTWVWSDPSSSWNYTSFNSGQPDNISHSRVEFQSATGTWYDIAETSNRMAVYMTRLQYSLNTFTIFNNFFLHSSGFSSSYANTDIASAVIAKWVRTDSPLTQPIEFRGNGNIMRNSQGSFTTSDIRLKENIVDTSPKLLDLLKVRVVNYNLKGSDGTKLIGVVAQELETLFPTLVNNGELSPHDSYLGKTESYKSVKYSCFDVILIKAFQEQMAIINKLSAQLDDLECKTKSLKTISQDHVILKQDLEFLKRENELFKLNINIITMLMAKC